VQTFPADEEQPEVQEVAWPVSGVAVRIIVAPYAYSPEHVPLALAQAEMAPLSAETEPPAEGETVSVGGPMKETATVVAALIELTVHVLPELEEQPEVQEVV
jgi:hypothetical protein